MGVENPTASKIDVDLPSGSNQNPAPRIALNIALVFSAQGVSRLISFGYMLYLARSLSPGDFGALNVALSILVIADAVLDCGLSRLLVRDLSQRPSAATLYLSNLVPFRLASACLAYGICVAIVTIAAYPASVTLCVVIAGMGLAFTGTAGLLESVLQAHHRFGMPSLAHFALSIVQAISGSVVVQSGGTLAMLAATFLLSNLLYAAIMLAGVRGIGIAFPFKFDRRFIVEKVSSALPFAGIGILFTLSMRTELLVLSWFADPAELGLYSAATRFNDAAMLAPITLAAVLTPFLSREAATDAGRLRLGFGRSVQYGLLAALPGTAVAILLAGPVIGFVLPNYEGAVALVQILFAAFPFFSLYCVTLALLTVTSSQHATFLLVLGISVVQVVMAVALISRFGALGAAASFAAWSVFAAVLALFAACKVVIRGRDLLRSALPAVLGGAAGAAVLWLGRSQPLAFSVPIALACYGLAAAGALWMSSSTAVRTVSTPDGR